MLRPWLRAARPDDWTGTLAAWGSIVLLALGLPLPALVTLPPAWVETTAGYEEPWRLLILLVVLYLWAWARALLTAALPGAPFFILGFLSFRSKGQRIRLRAREIVEIAVITEPPEGREWFELTLRGGERHLLCPVTWAGAGRLFRRLRRYANVRG